MAFINLLPEHLRKAGRHERRKSAQISGPLPTFKFSITWAIGATTVSCLIILALLFIRIQANKNTLRNLEQKIQEINLGYQKINEITAKKGQLNDTVSFMQKVSAIRMSCSDEFYTIAKLLPAQVWLTNISFESKPAREVSRTKTEKTDVLFQEQIRNLTIKGSATSLIEAEIFTAITQFVELLKKDAAFSKDFSDIKLGPLQSDRKGNLIIMNFVIYCKSGKYS